MDRIKFEDLRLEPLAGSRIVVWQRWLWMILFVATFLVVIGRRYLPALVTGNAAWPEACLLFLAAGWILTSLARQLPLQNVLLAGCILGGIPSLAMILNHYASIPFGPVVFSGRVPMVPGGIPLFAPLIWIVAILSSRGVARLALRPWRQGGNYGFWLFGVTVALTLVFDLGLEFFAAHGRGYWTWSPTRIPFSWFGTPLTNFLGWAMVTILSLAFATPALINKKPVRFPPDYDPLVIWTMAMFVFALAGLKGA
jgi:uncharacterized membrane protein